MLRPLINMVCAGCNRSSRAQAARNLVRMRANQNFLVASKSDKGRRSSSVASCVLGIGKIHLHFHDSGWSLLVQISASAS